MTKYEWESELKKNIHRLPADEIKRVMEYYDELFADMIERGKGECEIISEFGNPVDVADKILSEYDGDILKEAQPVITPDVSAFSSADKSDQTEVKREEVKPRENKCDSSATQSTAVFPEIELAKSDPEPKCKNCGDGKVHLDRLVLFLILNVVTGFALFWVMLSVWIVAVAFTVSGVAMAVGGAAGTFVSLVQVFRGFVGSGFAQIGGCIALCGIGILLSVLMIKLMKLLGRATVALFSAISRWIYTPKPDLSGAPVEHVK